MDDVLMLLGESWTAAERIGLREHIQTLVEISTGVVGTIFVFVIGNAMGAIFQARFHEWWYRERQRREDDLSARYETLRQDNLQLQYRLQDTQRMLERLEPRIGSAMESSRQANDALIQRLIEAEIREHRVRSLRTEPACRREDAVAFLVGNPEEIAAVFSDSLH